MMRQPILLAIACAFSFPFGVCDTAVGAEPPKPAEPIKLILHPAAEPVPALKYRLLPAYTEQIDGNATVFYGKVKAEEDRFFGQPQLADKLDQWQKLSLAELLKADVRLPYGAPFLFLEQGAKCKYSDWQLPIGDMPFYEILLPDVQQSRTFSRMLAVKARLEIAQGKFDDAVKTFQTNYALARNVAAGETIVNGLVGIAMGNIMLPQITECIQQPKSPNLYWALTMLPNPMIDMRRAIDVESLGMELTFPDLKNVMTARHTAEEWREIFQRFSKEVFPWIKVGDEKPKMPTGEALEEACSAAARKEKGILIQGGMSTEEVQAMPVHQLALIHIMRVHHELFDDGAKCYSLPYSQAIAGIEAAIKRAMEAEENDEQILPISSNILKAVRTARSASVRADREIAMLRTFEALRLYGASHHGELPQQLSDITEVPIPDDPVTGEPFSYRREAEKALLEGPVLREVPLKYEITMLPPK